MSSKLPLLLGVVSMIGTFAVPWVKQSIALVGNSRDWTPDPQFAKLPETCKQLHPEKLLGCEKFVIVDGAIYAACITDWDIRRKWFPPMDLYGDVGPLGTVKGKLFRVDIDTHELTDLKLKGFPVDTDISVHGLDVIKVAPNLYSIYMVNHRRNGSVIEKFHLNKGDNFVTYLDTFAGSEAGLYNPNDVTAIPISTKFPDSISAFYSTNDHYFQHSKLGRTLELLLRLPLGAVYFHSTTTGFHKAASWIVGANGITNVNGKLFVAAILNGEILIYTLPKSPAEAITTGLTFIRKVVFDFVMDNLNVDAAKKWLYMTGHPNPTTLEANWVDPDHNIGPSASYRMSLAELEPGFFGTKGETGSMTIEKVVVDNQGKVSNASCSGVGDDARRKFWISGLTTKGISECDLPDVSKVPRDEDEESSHEEAL